MRNNENGDTQLAVDILQKRQHGLGGKRVQRAGGLIAQKHLGACGQGPGNGYTLFLPAGKLRRVGPGLIGKAHKVQKLLHARGHGLFVVPLFQFQGKGHVLGHCFLHQQVVTLKHNAHFAPCAAQRLARQGGKVFPIQQHAALCGFFQHR